MQQQQQQQQQQPQQQPPPRSSNRVGAALPLPGAGVDMNHRGISQANQGSGSRLE
jgi:hypothetical protein